MAKKILGDKPDLDLVINQLEKAFPGSVFTGEKIEEICKLDYMHTGSHILDIALGGGIVRGKMMTIYGMEGCLKTTTAMMIASEAISRGEKVVFIDIENSVNIPHAQNMGLDTSGGDFIYIRAETGEEAFDKIEDLTETGEVDLIILDSIASLPTEEEYVGTNGDRQMGSQAKVVGKGMRKCNPKLAKNGTALILINQVRFKIGGYGNPETLPGGKAIDFFAYHKLRMGRPEILLNSDMPVGAVCSFKEKKSKTNSIITDGHYTVYWDGGVDRTLDVLNAAVLLGVVEKSSSRFSYGDIKVQGLKGLKALDIDSIDSIEKDVEAMVQKLRDGEIFEKKNGVFTVKE